MFQIRTYKNFTPWHCYNLLRYSTSTTPAPGRIYNQRQLFEEKRAMLTCNNPEKYALSSMYLNNRADRPKDYKPDKPIGRNFALSPQEKRLLVLTGVYKRESDIPELVNETRIAIMKERLNLLVAILWGFMLLSAIIITYYKALDVMKIVETKK